MQDDLIKENDVDYDDSYINLAHLIYKEAKLTILRDECENILLNILTDPANNDYYDIKDIDEENKARTL